MLRGYVEKGNFSVAYNAILGLKNGGVQRIFFVPDQNPQDAYDHVTEGLSHNLVLNYLSNPNPLSQGKEIPCPWLLGHVETGVIYDVRCSAGIATRRIYQALNERPRCFDLGVCCTRAGGSHHGSVLKDFGR